MREKETSGTSVEEKEKKDLCGSWVDNLSSDTMLVFSMNQYTGLQELG